MSMRGQSVQEAESQRIAVVGSGYVGTVVAACFAYLGHNVIAVESDEAKLVQLNTGKAPFREPELDSLLARTLADGSLTFTADLGFAAAVSELIFLCVGTPLGDDGRPDVTALLGAARELAVHARDGHIVVTKSTVPVGTGEQIHSLMKALVGRGPRDPRVHVVSNPEFLREGNAVDDFLHPDRIVVGGDDDWACGRVIQAHSKILQQQIPPFLREANSVPLVRTGLATAEMTKYASNAFLATKVSFANEIGRVSALVGADVTEVMAAVGLDARIGSRYLDAGIGWGGSCLGKDLSALIGTAEERGYHPRLLEAVGLVNEDQRQLVVDELERLLESLSGLRVGVFGLAFKSGIDDVRDSPGVDVVRRLMGRGAFVTAYDPMVRTLPGNPEIDVADDPFRTASGVDAIVVTTDSPEILTVDLARLRCVMRGDIFFDGRNLFAPDLIREAGFRYIGVARPASPKSRNARSRSTESDPSGRIGVTNSDVSANRSEL